MIEPGDRVFDCLDRGAIGRQRTAQHDNVDAERARRGDLAVGRGTAAVLGNHHVDTMLGHQCMVVGFTERATTGDIADTGQWQRRIDRIDAADPIMVMGRGIGIMSLLPSGCQEHPQGCFAKRRNRLRHTMHGKPIIACDRRPGRSAQGKGLNAALSRCLYGIGRDTGRKRMGRIDHQIDRFIAQIAGKTLCAAEAAAAHRDRLRGRIGGSAGQRQHDIEIGAGGECYRQCTSFRRAAQDQNAGLAHG